MTADPAMMATSVSSALLSGIKTAGLFALLYMAGHAVLGLIMDIGRPRRGPFELMPGSGYGAVALGPAAVLILSSILRASGVYRPWTTGSCLIGLVTIAAFSSGSFRKQFSSVKRIAIPLSAYLACMVAIWLTFPPQSMPLMKATSVYLMQGFDLFSTPDPMQWPYFGELFRMPVMYVTHTIGTVFGLFSAGDPSRYFLYGQYWIVIALGPLVPLGFYLFLRGQVPRWMAAVIAFLFCFWILGPRTWSIRGETLGWICGLSFLILGREILSMLEARVGGGRAVRLSIAAALCYFTMAVTHGVSAMISTFLFTGLGIAGLLGYPRRLPVLAIGKPIAAFGCTIGAMAAIYFVLFCGIHSPHQIIFNNDLPPVAGEADPALLIEQQLGPSIPLTLRPIIASPPYTNPLHMAAAAALLPVAAIFRRSFDQIGLDGFPFEAYIKLKSLPLPELCLYILLIGLSFAFYVRCLYRKLPVEYFNLVFTSVFVMALCVAFVVYLDFNSFSIYPLASTRRVYPYVRFFYGVTVILTLLEMAQMVLGRSFPAGANSRTSTSRSNIGVVRDSDRTAGAASWKPWRASAGRLSMVDGAVIVVLFCAVLFATMTLATGRLWNLDWMSQRVAATAVERTDDLLGQPSPPRDAVGVMARTLAVDDAANRGRSNLIAAFDFIRQNTVPGEWIYSNIISDNQFWYLSSGRLSLYEGSAMYQVFALQRRAAAHMANFHALAADGDLHRLADYGVKLLMIYRHGSCRDSSCYGFDVAATQACVFDDRPGIVSVFSNQDYDIYRIEHDNEAPPPLTASTRCALPYTYGTPIDFTSDGDDPYIGAGWSTPEEVGTWTDGTSAKLLFGLAPPGSDVALTAIYTPYLPPGYPAPIVTAKVGDKAIARWTTAGGGEATRCTIIPAQSIGSKGDLDVTLDIDGPPSPAELHWVNDSRHLGILVRSMTLDDTPEAVARCRQQEAVTQSGAATAQTPAP